MLLPWHEYRGVAPEWDDSSVPASWSLESYGDAQTQPGVTLRLSGTLAHDASAICQQTTGWWRKMRSASRATKQGRLVMVAPLQSSCTDELATLTALFALLRTRPALRERLVEPERLQRLATDMTDGLLPMPTEISGARRESTDMIVAVHQAGFSYEFRRPLSAAGRPSLDEVVAKTLPVLDANPYRHGLTADPEQLAQIVRRVYLDVQPWPFSALVDDAPASGSH
ncbi:MAG TPA: hypothetical protein VGM78_11540 [Ilumatobacteraceae bacterium]